ncbi:GFA family protein [Streptomyces lydicus]
MRADSTLWSDGCLCRRIRFTITGEADYPHTCSCTHCQRAVGRPDDGLGLLPSERPDPDRGGRRTGLALHLAGLPAWLLPALRLSAVRSRPCTARKSATVGGPGIADTERAATGEGCSSAVVRRRSGRVWGTLCAVPGEQ